MTVHRLQWTLAILTVLLGLGHLSFLSGFGGWSLDALWFAGTGLAFILGGALNIAAVRARGDRLVRGMTVLADLGLTGFFAAAWTVLPAPQVAVGGLLFLALTAATAAGGRRTA